VVPILLPVGQAKGGSLQHESVGPSLVKRDAHELMRDGPTERRRKSRHETAQVGVEGEGTGHVQQ